MAGAIEQKLASLGISLHQPNPPVANYVGFVRSGNLLFVSGQVCNSPEGKLLVKGKLGGGVTVEQGAAGARACAINLLAQAKAALGVLDKVARVVRLGGAWTTFRGRRLKVLRAEPIAAELPAGTLDDSVVGTSAGGLRLLAVQPEAGRPMSADAWRNGAQPRPGERLGA